MNKINKYFCIVAIVICAGCVNTAQRHQLSAEESAARMAQEKAEEQRRLEEQQKAIEQRKVLIKNKVDLIVKQKVVNPKNIDYKTYFGDQYTDNRQGEFETKEDYVKRFKSIVNPNEIYYFDSDVKLSRYDLDNEQYSFKQPEVLDSSPVGWMPLSDRDKKMLKNFVDPSLARFTPGYDSNSAMFLWIPLKKEEKRSTYKGQNAYGTSATISKVETNRWGLAAIFDGFKNMFSYGYELESINRTILQKYLDGLVIKIPANEAKTLKLKSSDILVRFGIKYSYGVGPVASGFTLDSYAPTLTSPLEMRDYADVLGVDLDSICFLRRKNMEVISCKVRLDD